MEIKVIQNPLEKRKAKPTDESKLGFGKIFSDHFFTMTYHTGRGWHDPLIEPYRPLQLDPTAMCLHYAQEIFEGLKAYRGKGGAIYLFRPLENVRRMNVSAGHLCMPQIDEGLFMEASKLVLLEKDWIPMATGPPLHPPDHDRHEPALGVHPATVPFFIIAGPVGAYYAEGFGPTRIFVTESTAGPFRGAPASARPAAITQPASMRAKSPKRWDTRRSCGSTRSRGSTWRK
jgi:branched-chain amino acid aminotransferase